ncbi:MAG TPA: hypothetical protein VK177_04435 [Flavobacteriales bacterium]|nr:hypothetical protein [Flavobacteriales bacterium]
MQRPGPFNVETILNQFVTEIGGELVSTLITDTKGQPNADYAFKKKNVIAELKCFQKDLFNGQNDQERLNALVEKWTERGLYTDQTLNMLFNGELPVEFKADLIQDARKSIDNVIRKANRQIRETKKILKMKDAMGLVLLCNDGNYFLRNEHYFGLICNLMANKYMQSDIDGILYFTINQVSRSPEDEFDHNVWLPAYRSDDSSLGDFVNEMGVAFMDEFYPKLTGSPLSHKFMTDNPEEGIKKISSLTYLPKAIAYKKEKQIDFFD